MVSSVVGEKVRNMVILPHERIRPPELRSASLSLLDSQRTEHNMVYIVFFWISLNEKLSTRSSTVEGSMLGSLVPDLCKYCRA